MIVTDSATAGEVDRSQNSATTCHEHAWAIYGRKFRSQTSDNMDKWKAQVGRVREEKRKKEDQKRESLRRKKMQMREKVGKSRNTVFFQWFVAPEARKVGSLKRRVRSPLGRWEMQNCTPLWREHISKSKCTKHIKTHQNTTCSDHFWKLRCRKSARRCGVKHICQWKMPKKKHLTLGALLEVAKSKKCTPLWREAHFEIKMHKTLQLRTTFGSWDVEKVHAVVVRSTFRSQKCKKLRGSEHFWTFRCRFAWQAQGIVHVVKIGGPGAPFPERGCILENQIFSFGKMILRDSKWSGKIAKRIGTRPSALHSTFHIWRKSRRIASFLMLST